MKYVLITGRPRTDETAKMEIISEDGTTVICQNSKYQEIVSGASAAVTDGTIVACGGRDESYEEIRSCYSYGGGRKWTKIPDMSTPRYSSSSVPIPGGIWVTGGYDGSKTLKTTEMVFINKTRQTGPSLPEARRGHCLVAFEDNFIYSTGGVDENDDVKKNTWKFNAGGNFANDDGPEMKNKRSFHGCGIVHSIHHDSRPLIVVAGSHSNWGATGMKSSEYWDFTKAGSTWQLCSKDLPTSMSGPRMTTTGDGNGLLMSYKKKVYSFHCTSPNNCFWQEEKYELQISRNRHLFLTVPSAVIEEC